MGRLIFINRVCWPAEEATAQLLINLVDGLAARGWECHVLTESAGPANRSRGSIIFHRLVDQVPARQTNLIAKALSYRRFSRLATQHLKAIIKPKDKVIAMTDPPLIGVKLASVVRSNDAGLWHWAQDIYPEVAMALTKNPLIRMGMKYLRRQRDEAWNSAEHIVTIGDDMANLIRSHVPAHGSVSVQPNWYPQAVDEAVDIDFRREWGFGDEDFLVLYSGNLGRAHTLEPIIEIAQLTRSLPNIKFVLVGEGAQKSDLMRRVAGAGLENVCFKSSVKRVELDSLLAAADVHFVTMRSECCGTVLPSKFYGILAAARPCIFIGPIDSDIATQITRHELGETCAPSNVAPAVDYLAEMASSETSTIEARKTVRNFHSELPGLAEAIDHWDRILRSDQYHPSSQND